MRGLFLVFVFISSLYSHENHFEPLHHKLPKADEVRLGSGAPGPKYWQQQVDYEMDIKLDEDKNTLTGTGKITYKNNSPHTLKYLWLHLDQNKNHKHSESRRSSSGSDLSSGTFPLRHFKGEVLRDKLEGVKITSATDKDGKKLSYEVVGTMMRINLEKELLTQHSFEFNLSWNMEIVDAKAIFSRTGYEYFEKDKNKIFTISQWYPRLVAYSDRYGWHTQQFLWAEFALEFGDYQVNITVPEDHLVAATGVMANEKEVLSAEQQKKLNEARKAEKPVFIVTQKEAEKKLKSKSKKLRTWKFKADNVRDFAFASSRRFIWDAMNCRLGEKDVLCMSFYPPEGNPLWERYSSHAVSHTLKTYSKYAFDYPYSTAQSINGPIFGMEYPMITFQSMRPSKDKTYSRRQKYGLISVIIHEIGHNYFPMIINSDERRHAWMDEGINCYVQYLAETEWEDNYHGINGKTYGGIKSYMSSATDQSIMTKADNIKSLGVNAYAKPSAGLVILRETIVGRKIFDKAFKEYCQRWKFKRPMPEDFFRTINEMTGRDLAWFWNSWFYSTDHVDISIESVEEYEINTRNPEIEKTAEKKKVLDRGVPITEIRNKTVPKLVDKFPELKDFYNSYDPHAILDKDKKDFEKYVKSLKEDEKKLLNSKKVFYVVKLKNIGGVPMPVILTLEYADGSKEVVKVPATFWRRGSKDMHKLLILDKKLNAVEHDVLDETLDTNRHNNRYPPRIISKKVDLTKGSKKGSSNPMKEQLDREKKKADAAKKKASEKK